MNPDFAGRNIVVTGGRGALGRAVVEAFLDRGAICHVPFRGADAGDMPTSERLRLVGGVELTDETQVGRFYAQLPGLWASVQAAGGFAMSPFLDTKLADLRAQLDQNLVSCFLCCREAVRRMSGGGRIVNVASRAAARPAGGAIGYTIAKSAVVALTQALAEEVKGVGILVNAVLPSVIDTPKNRQSMPGSRAEGWTPPAEVASAILWLASPDNRLTSGAALPVYGRA